MNDLELNLLALLLTLFILFQFASTVSLADDWIPGKNKPKLVLQITVDQLCGDMPRRFLDKMGLGGFRYLLENGIVYENAHHALGIYRHKSAFRGEWPNFR